nr:CrcB family protein [uncultured Porphyromonas sp.]
METLSFRAICFVFIGGGLGSLLRYFTGWGVAHLLGHATAWATWGINALGSLVIGYLIGLSAREVGLNDDYRYLLIIGLCGGFTTFSTFSADLLHYLRSWAYLQAGGYLLVSIVSALLLVYLGFRWGRS